MIDKRMTDVGYQTSGDEEKSKPTGEKQFKGKNMPQDSKVKNAKDGSKKSSKPKAKKPAMKKKEMSMISDKRISDYGKKMKKRGI